MNDRTDHTTPCPEDSNPWDEMGMLFENRWVMSFTYTNWRGVTDRRQVRALLVWFGKSKWHPDPQWFLKADDLDKSERRDFAMKDMTDVTYA